MGEGGVEAEQYGEGLTPAGSVAAAVVATFASSIQASPSAWN
jgi:hypothetical protein